MKLNRKYNILLGIFIFTGLFSTTPYGKNIVYTINTVHEDKFTPQIKKELEQASEQDMKEFLQAVAKGAHSRYPIKKSDDEIILDLVYKNNVLIYIKKINYSKLLNLKNINHNKKELTKALTIGTVAEVCSQKLLSYMLINKNISVEYKFNNEDMQLIDDIVVEKSNCVNWHKNNKTYTFINSIFELFEY